MRNYQQCTYCVMDTTDPDIVFDTNGRCNHCIEFEKQALDFQKTEKWSSKTLEQLIAEIKLSGRNKKYDCVLGVSGGVDSSYLAYQLKQLGLRVLLVHMDNGWDSYASVANIKNMVDILEFDYESYVLDWKEFQQLQLAFLKADVIEAETPTDIAISGCLHKVAAKYNVKYIIGGGNLSTEGILPAHWHYNHKDKKYLTGVNRIFGNPKLKNFPHFGFWEEVYYKVFKGIKMAYVINFFNFEKRQAIELLKDKLNWRQYGGKHHESYFTKFVQAYLLPAKFALDYRRATYSSMICSGQMSREDALNALQKFPYDPATIEEDLTYVAAKLDIDAHSLKAIIRRPAKSYKDYPNADKILQPIYKLYKWIKS